MSDYEWVLAFEADTLDRLEGVIHHQRYTEARLHVRQDTPFYTGSRVTPARVGGAPAAGLTRSSIAWDRVMTVGGPPTDRIEEFHDHHRCHFRSSRGQS